MLYAMFDILFCDPKIYGFRPTSPKNHHPRVHYCTSTYRSFIGMNMTRKDNVYFIIHKTFLIHNSHAFTFHIVMHIAAIHWTMDKHNKPWCLSSVHFRQFLFKPLILRSIFSCKLKCCEVSGTSNKRYGSDETKYSYYLPYAE